jgi:uncharacterized protein YhbP (UPF0306 family)
MNGYIKGVKLRGTILTLSTLQNQDNNKKQKAEMQYKKTNKRAKEYQYNYNKLIVTDNSGYSWLVCNI